MIGDQERNSFLMQVTKINDIKFCSDQINSPTIILKYLNINKIQNEIFAT